MDRDVVNLIHRLHWDVTIDWNQPHDWCFCGADTPVDAANFLVGANNQIPKQLRDFVIAVDHQMKGLPREDFMFGYPITDERPRKKGTLRPCFVAMPYRPKWFEAVMQTILNAGTATGFDCIVSLEMATAGKIEDQIWDQLRRAEAVIADLTGSNPNVYYEVGLAHALGKRIIFITQDDTPLPFDVLTSRYIRYAESDLGQLQNELERAFAAVKQRYQFDPEPPK
jgi:hypothetical protein